MTTHPATTTDFLDTPLAVVLHVFVAFDWGEEIDLTKAAQLVPGFQPNLARRRRTPTSIAYRPAPLRFSIAEQGLRLPNGMEATCELEATIFDFGAMSCRWQVPLSTTPRELLAAASSLADATALVAEARNAVSPLYQRLLPAIIRPNWSELSEEYFVFQIPPHAPGFPLAELIERHPGWLAALLRLETEPLSADEVQEALRLRLSYGLRDMFICEWSAGLLCDENCEETFQTIEFANVQLLEYRHIDQRLDDQLSDAYRTIHPLTRSWLPFWRSETRRLRGLGELRVEANSLFERAGNALKLVGDQYLARVYRLLAARFHLEDWQQNIGSALDVLERVYDVVSDQTSILRGQLLEVIVVALIALEVVMALLRH